VGCTGKKISWGEKKREMHHRTSMQSKVIKKGRGILTYTTSGKQERSLGGYKKEKRKRRKKKGGPHYYCIIFGGKKKKLLTSNSKGLGRGKNWRGGKGEVGKGNVKFLR